MGMLENLLAFGRRVLEDPNCLTDFFQTDLGEDATGDSAPACDSDEYSYRTLLPWERPAYCHAAGDSEEERPREGEPSPREVIGRLGMTALFPGYHLFSDAPKDPLGEIDSFLESAGVYGKLRNFRDALEKSGEARRARLKHIEENGIEVNADEVAEKIQETLGSQMKNVKVELKDGRIVVQAEIPTDYLVTLDFVAVLDVSIREGKIDAQVKKAEVSGLDKKDAFQEKLFNALQARGQAVPDGAGIKDLSWMDNQGIKNLVVQEGRILVEMYPPPTGPS